ncbi:MAG: aromatic-ring-hydroxylating dioxygenase subunit beta [Betaproteobacteria bacterium]
MHELHARYAHALDEDRLEDWPNFFTEQGVYRIATAENEARGLPAPILFAQGRAMLRDRVASLRHANIYEPQRYRHMVSSVLLGDPSGDEVSVKSSFLVIRVMENGEASMFASGIYHDRIVLSKMQYAERVVVCDSRRFDTLLAIPL